MRLRQQNGVWHVSVTRRINHGRGSASLYHLTSNVTSETRTYTTARKPVSAQAAWNAAGRANAPKSKPGEGVSWGDALLGYLFLAAIVFVVVMLFVH
jgi:hypothetical protein